MMVMIVVMTKGTQKKTKRIKTIEKDDKVERG